ncbi:MAG: preprotein translocase subunit YajC [Alphaproteobacteria bacterium]|nr:preprotein translocase subunit YajC [Alphaproteobacteria bacterium]
MLITEAFANTAGSLDSQSVMATVIQLGLIFLIFYLLLIRPQQKKMKEHTNMLEAIKIGDKIITGGGIYAKVLKVNGLELTVEISSGVEVVVNRMSVREVVAEVAPIKSIAKTKKSKK